MEINPTLQSEQEEPRTEAHSRDLHYRHRAFYLRHADDIAGRTSLVLCFRNNRPMVSGCTVDFITPGVDDRLAVDVVDEGHQAVLEFVFGSDADMAQ